MKSVTLSLAALVATASAQGWIVQSPGFRLILQSDNASLQGHALAACHQGAAIEGLCLSSETSNDPPAVYTTFYQNVSQSSYDDSPAFINESGPLSYILHASGGFDVPSPLKFIPDTGSNIADMIFTPSEFAPEPIAFDETGSAFIFDYTDDTVSPPEYRNSPLKLKNWYICVTKFSYLYTSLVWKYGVTGEPQNPSCTHVEVFRVWNEGADYGRRPRVG